MFLRLLRFCLIVPNGSKILIWKQITTCTIQRGLKTYCSQWFKDTNLKANHNRFIWFYLSYFIVPNGSKILIWKQITTYQTHLSHRGNCSQWFKDTNLKANHNCFVKIYFFVIIVPNGSKILIWKQITTMSHSVFVIGNCSQWFKDTNLKANHNIES